MHKMIMWRANRLFAKISNLKDAIYDHYIAIDRDMGCTISRLLKSVFFDENAIEYFDPDHSEEEGRYLMLGFSYRLRVLVVSHSLREDDSDIRIISARKATKKEQRAYTGEKR